MGIVEKINELKPVEPEEEPWRKPGKIWAWGLIIVGFGAFVMDSSFSIYLWVSGTLSLPISVDKLREKYPDMKTWVPYGISVVLIAIGLSAGHEIKDKEQRPSVAQKPAPKKEVDENKKVVKVGHCAASGDSKKSRLMAQKICGRLSEFSGVLVVNISWPQIEMMVDRSLYKAFRVDKFESKAFVKTVLKFYEQEAGVSGTMDVYVKLGPNSIERFIGIRQRFVNLGPFCRKKISSSDS